MDDYLLASLILQRRSQYLVHCFLYYELNESIVSDEDYWRWCDELIQLQKDYPDVCAEIPHHELCKDLSTDYSRPEVNGQGAAEKDYPRGTVSIALHLLHHDKKSRKSFASFAKDYGYALEDLNK